MFAKCNLAKNLKASNQPINIDLTKTTKTDCYPLHCNYFENVATKLKLVNTGSTALIRGVWPADRPCLEDGPLKGKYIFSQLHFHWGKISTAGASHTVDEEKQAMEMHAVFFKKNYMYPEIAKQKDDGIIIIIYIMKFQLFPNHSLDDIAEKLKEVKMAGSETYLKPVALSDFIPTFENDYMVYRAPVKDDPAIWFISRIPIGISEPQVKAFQSLLDASERQFENFESKCYSPNKKYVWYVNPARSQIATLLRPRY